MVTKPLAEGTEEYNLVFSQFTGQGGWLLLRRYVAAFEYLTPGHNCVGYVARLQSDLFIDVRRTKTRVHGWDRIAGIIIRCTC